MRSLPEIYKAIADEGFSARVLKLINEFTNAITDGRTNFSRYTIPEHAGVCTAGEVLIGATVVASYARTSLEASADAARGQEVRPSNWKIDPPFVRCQRLATKPEIDAMVSPKGFHDNGDGNGTNYISDRITLEDMHPANVFIDDTTGKPICIDCIVKFRN